jgi:hypothetical protein
MDMFELFKREEALHPELQACLSDTRGCSIIKHRLCISVMHMPQMNACVNASYQMKLDKLSECTANRDFGMYVFLHERPFRGEAILDVSAQMSDQDYWSLVGHTYQDSENIEELPDLWRKLLCAQRDQRHAMMDESERQFLNGLPEQITVWRGVNSLSELDLGYSWTIDERIAHWFAGRLNGGMPGYVCKGYVCKEQVVAYLEGRGESEIIALPEHVVKRETFSALPNMARRFR